MTTSILKVKYKQRSFIVKISCNETPLTASLNLKLNLTINFALILLTF